MLSKTELKAAERCKNWVRWKLNHQENWTKKGKILFVKFRLLLVIYINAFGKYIVFKELIFIIVHAFLGIEPDLDLIRIWTTEFLG